MHTDDTDITSARAIHPELCGVMYFERTRQDRRTYYRLHTDGGNRTAGLTDAQHARETIAYWREKGWLQTVSRFDQR